MRSQTPLPGSLPNRYQEFQKQFPQVFQAYENLGAAVRGAGPLDETQCALIKLAIAVGARQEGAVHSHARRALEAGCSKEEIRQVALLAIPTVGFPNMMAALSWIEDVLEA